MRRQTVTKRRATDDDLDLRYVLLRFTDGLVVDPRTCPQGIHARPHWHAGPPAATGANAVCDHVDPRVTEEVLTDA
jgi:hypothetical protein